MRLIVRLFTTLARYAPEAGKAAGTPFEIELPVAAPVSALLVGLNLPEKDVKIVFVNGRHRPFDYVLEDGDEVGIFPAVGGG